MIKSDELLLRLQLLLSEQIQNLQKYKSTPNGDIYKDAYMEIMKLIPLLNEIPNIKLICHEGKFWKQRDIDKRYHRNRYDFLIDVKLNEKHERERNFRKSKKTD